MIDDNMLYRGNTKLLDGEGEGELLALLAHLFLSLFSYFLTLLVVDILSCLVTLKGHNTIFVWRDEN